MANAHIHSLNLDFVRGNYVKEIGEKPALPTTGPWQPKH